MAKRARRIDLGVYQALGEFEAGFAEIQKALEGLYGISIFDRVELARFAGLIEESRAATSSYLLGVIEDAETREAGRLYRTRMKDQRNQNAGAS